MTKEGYRKILTVAFYVWVITLYVLTALPGHPGPEKYSDSPVRWDYLEHFFLFMGIPVVYFLSGGAGIKVRTIRSGIILILAGLTYAILAEVQQKIVPGRAYNPVDLSLNLSGFLMGIPTGRFFSSVFRSRFGW